MKDEPQDLQSQAPPTLPVPESAVREPLPLPLPPKEAGPAAASASEPAAPSSLDLDKRLVFADQTHQYIREYIRLADQKAALFFTTSGALLAFLYNADTS